MSDLNIRILPIIFIIHEDNILFMVTKTLSISEEAYNSLIVLKQGNESFTDLIIRLTNKERKGISAVLNWLEALPKDDEELLVELSNSVEAVVHKRDEGKWRSVEL